jgi:hypothetical protein
MRPARCNFGTADALAESRGRYMYRGTKEDLGLNVSHSKTVFLDVRIEYEVEPLDRMTTESNTTSSYPP